jgi:hypothetical protein
MGMAIIGLMLVVRIIVPVAVLLFFGSMVERRQAF